MCTLESRCKPPAHGTRHAPPLPPSHVSCHNPEEQGQAGYGRCSVPVILQMKGKKVLLESLVAGEGRRSGCTGVRIRFDDDVEPGTR